MGRGQLAHREMRDGNLATGVEPKPYGGGSSPSADARIRKPDGWSLTSAVYYHSASKVRSQQMVSTPIAELNREIVKEDGWNEFDFIIQTRD